MAIVARMTPSNNNPVGQVVSSTLTEVQFQAQNGSQWILADGRSVAGSRYASITGSSTVPDLRGMVLRGKNNGRSDGNQDPDGERAIGNFQDHQFGSHGHNLFGRGGSSPTNVGDRMCSSGANASAPDRTFQEVSAAATGGNETRMRNVAVNHFIKINP